ncbi:MAG: trigger factor [Lachnospiraceae bacterium]|nr:trigger factor [Lachnospiraceae bacterium]
MKKKLALVCMAGVLVLSVSACGGKKAVSEETQTDSVETTQDASEGTVAEEETESTSTEIERVSDRPDYVGLQDIDINDYVELADYKNMKVSAEKPDVSDETIEEYINSELLVGNITDRAVQEGDVADIDFEGKKDGVAFDGGTAQGYKLSIGSGSFIPGFEDGLVGVMPGETVDLNLTFPENYPSEDLAGQEVVFTVTVNSIQGSAQYADVTVDEMKSMGLSYKTKEEVWEAGKKVIEENADQAFVANSQNAILDALVEKSKVSSVPELLVEEQVQNYNLYMESMAQAYGMDLESMVGAYGKTMDEYNAEINEMCSKTMETYMILEAVARAEGIEITDEMIREKAAEEAAEYAYESAEALIEEVGYSTYRMTILRDTVMDRLMELITVEEQAAQEDTAE